MTEEIARQFIDGEWQTVVAAAGGGGAAAVFAQVSYRGALVNPWDGSTVNFNTVDYDPGDLWNDTYKGFEITTPGWYYVNVWGEVAASNVGNTTAQVFVQVYGAGWNVVSRVFVPAGGSAYVPTVSGHVHLDAADLLDVQGSGPTDFTHDDLFFSIRLVTADA